MEFSQKVMPMLYLYRLSVYMLFDVSLTVSESVYKMNDPFERSLYIDAY